MSLRKIGFLCVGLKDWISLERTKKFYVSSLKKANEVFLIENENAFFEQLDSFDIVINFFGNLAWEHRNSIKSPVMFCLHGGAVLNYKYLVNNAGKVKSCDSFIVNCTSDIAILQKVFETPPKTHLLKLPVSNDLTLQFSKSDCKSALNINAETLVFGYVARILPQKNLHQAILMLSKAKNEITENIKLIVIGDYWIDYPVLNWQTEKNEYHAYINKLIDELQLRENILQFQSNLSNEELALCYGAFDFLIHPTNSLDENFGYAPIEAMKCGTPVIGTAYGGLKDSITHEKTGYLLDTWTTQSGIRSNYNEGLQFVKTVHDNPDLKFKITENCLERANEYYSHENCALHLRQMVETAAAEKITKATLSGNKGFLRYEQNDLLPKTNPSWSYYKNVAQLYCNSSLPYLQSLHHYSLETFGKFRISEKFIHFEDPTWPLKIPFDAHVEEVLVICKETTPFNLLQSRISFPLKEDFIMNLISKGALLFSKS